ncbi:response regulator [Clostridium sp.]|jgi:two-component system chemotaxis response regulator CheY|uniref:response regulator n=1 Tax=Clostridium sp. TaxID=1506 RepID=UPI002850F4CB|nr:response regulator [Clostridium sp.]MDR3598450.1 response regulator [Clostridium sp.]
MIKILIVDDSVFSQKTTANLIKKVLDNNVEVYFAKDGKDGFKKYKDIMPDYTLLDLLMPELNGQGLLKLIKELNNEAKVFIISADVQKSVRTEVEEYDVLAFINKPFNEEKAQLVCDMIRKDING